MISSLLAYIPLFSLAITDPVFAQTTDSLSTYENPDFGLRFQYPSHWIIENNPYDPSLGGNIQGFMVLLGDAERLSLYFRQLGEFELPSNMTLKEFVTTMYRPDAPKAVGYTLIDDNQTTIGNGHEAWMVEYSEGEGDSSRYVMDIYTINEGSGYTFRYMVEQEADSSDNYQEVRKLLDSIEFIPLTPAPKQPSFLE